VPFLPLSMLSAPSPTSVVNEPERQSESRRLSTVSTATEHRLDSDNESENSEKDNFGEVTVSPEHYQDMLSSLAQASAVRADLEHQVNELQMKAASHGLVTPRNKIQSCLQVAITNEVASRKELQKSLDYFSQEWALNGLPEGEDALAKLGFVSGYKGKLALPVKHHMPQVSSSRSLPQISSSRSLLSRARRRMSSAEVSDNSQQAPDVQMTQALEGCESLIRRDLHDWFARQKDFDISMLQTDGDTLMWNWIRDFHREKSDQWFDNNKHRLQGRFEPFFREKWHTMRCATD